MYTCGAEEVLRVLLATPYRLVALIEIATNNNKRRYPLGRRILNNLINIFFEGAANEVDSDIYIFRHYLRRLILMVELRSSVPKMKEPSAAFSINTVCPSLTL